MSELIRGRFIGIDYLAVFIDQEDEFTAVVDHDLIAVRPLCQRTAHAPGTVKIRKEIEEESECFTISQFVLDVAPCKSQIDMTKDGQPAHREQAHIPVEKRQGLLLSAEILKIRTGEGRFIEDKKTQSHKDRHAEPELTVSGRLIHNGQQQTAQDRLLRSIMLLLVTWRKNSCSTLQLPAKAGSTLPKITSDRQKTNQQQEQSRKNRWAAMVPSISDHRASAERKPHHPAPDC